MRALTPATLTPASTPWAPRLKFESLKTHNKVRETRKPLSTWTSANSSSTKTPPFTQPVQSGLLHLAGFKGHGRSKSFRLWVAEVGCEKPESGCHAMMRKILWTWTKMKQFKLWWDAWTLVITRTDFMGNVCRRRWWCAARVRGPAWARQLRADSLRPTVLQLVLLQFLLRQLRQALAGERPVQSAWLKVREETRGGGILFETWGGFGGLGLKKTNTTHPTEPLPQINKSRMSWREGRRLLWSRSRQTGTRSGTVCTLLQLTLNMGTLNRA